MPIVVLKLILGLPVSPRVVVIMTTPDAAFDPKTAEELASFNISIVAMSLGFISAILPLYIAPSRTSRGLLFASIEF